MECSSKNASHRAIKRNMAKQGGGNILPFELLEKCKGQKVWLIMKESHEFAGTLVGFDELMNIVLKHTKEYTNSQTIERGELLLNGTNVLMIVPGAEP
mmetsp:Transcript_8880/g.13240  ORF Transcript_8880/g.13240 Transcript_8880/m.13240 type:complete len:98 (-) Transcript_8880:1040-1333(-)